VLRDCSIDCSSPISANTLLKTLVSELLSAGICKPDWAINTNKPTVFNATVLPPVLGPVITRIPNFSPSLTLIGTAFSFNRGCLAPFILIFCFWLIRGSPASIWWLSLPLAIRKSIVPAVSTPALISSRLVMTWLVNCVNILIISCFSWAITWRNSLLFSTAAAGSINRVAPLADWSWIMPGIWLRYSCLTGTTYLSPRMVTMGSCRYFWNWAERTIESILSFKDTWRSRILWRSLRSSEEALSATSPPGSILSFMRSSNSLNAQRLPAKSEIMG